MSCISGKINAFFKNQFALVGCNWIVIIGTLEISTWNNHIVQITWFYFLVWILATSNFKHNINFPKHLLNSITLNSYIISLEGIYWLCRRNWEFHSHFLIGLHSFSTQLLEELPEWSSCPFSHLLSMLYSIISEIFIKNSIFTFITHRKSV